MESNADYLIFLTFKRFEDKGSFPSFQDDRATLVKFCSFHLQWNFNDVVMDLSDNI